MRYKIDFKGYSKSVKRRVQEICFESNVFWNSGSKKIARLSSRYLIIGDSFAVCERSAVFNNSALAKITPEEFIAKHSVTDKIPKCEINLEGYDTSLSEQIERILVNAGFRRSISSITEASNIGIDPDIKLYYQYSSKLSACPVSNIPEIDPIDFISKYGTKGKSAENNQSNHDIQGDEAIRRANSAMTEADERPLSKLEQEYADRQTIKATESQPDPIVSLSDNDFDHRLGLWN